jgi:uracil-DNA glycosylase
MTEIKLNESTESENKGEAESKSKTPAIEASWLLQIGEEFKKPYMDELRQFLKSEYAAGKEIFPPKDEYFTALNSTPFAHVKVVILGQDPYHGRGQAHGLCFSVRKGVAIPPSLINIHKELRTDLDIVPPRHGYLQDWAKAGVLLLNSVLTVEQGRAGSHQKKGWEVFTDAVIKALSEQREHLVFILWGAYAQKKGQFIRRDKHLVIEAVHPSPLSVHRGFYGSKPFSKANTYLKSKKMAEVDWHLSD